MWKFYCSSSSVSWTVMVLEWWRRGGGVEEAERWLTPLATKDLDERNSGEAAAALTTQPAPPQR